ncbi:cell division ATP-binding protein FtsE, partial [Streptomyces sp. NPDC059083]|uniref:cell division ATP-binding protein FtsE n=1 Tax=Streptomyces sp. NPDC059083 TaxID=3346721 RepID=UPI0036993991
MITLRNVTKSYQTSTRPALDNISVDIEKGEFVFVIGPSGSGKSTFMRLLLKDEKPTTGEVWVADFRVDRLPGRKVPKLRQRIGCVFQDFRLLQQKTVEQNVAFALEVIGKSRAYINRSVPGPRRASPRPRLDPDRPPGPALGADAAARRTRAGSGRAAHGGGRRVRQSHRDHHDHLGRDRDQLARRP